MTIVRRQIGGRARMDWKPITADQLQDALTPAALP